MWCNCENPKPKQDHPEFCEICGNELRPGYCLVCGGSGLIGSPCLGYVTCIACEGDGLFPEELWNVSRENIQRAICSAIVTGITDTITILG